MNESEHLEHQLDDILTHYIECNRKLLDLIKNERHHIIHNELEALDRVNDEKLTLKEEITALETQRISLLHEFIKQYSLPKGQVRLEDLINVVPEPYKDNYKSKRETLRKLLRNIQMTHDGNKMLIERSLNFQERSFMLLFGLTRQNVRYGATGEVQHDQKLLVDSVA